MSHKNDLEEAIRESHRLIREYKDIRRLSSDPKERMRSWRSISEQQELVERYLEEYVSLCQRLNLHMPPDILEITVASSRDGYTGSEENTEVISVLFLAADPTDTSRLRLGEELRKIQEILQLAKLRERFELHERMAVRPADISQSMLDVQPQIVYFSGHGKATGAVCFENQMGETHPVQPNALAALFEQFANQVNCVVLNTCYSESQAIAIAKHIDYVVGMNQAIGDKAAIAFSVGFYQALGAGSTVEESYKLGCVQIRLQGIPEHLTPVLIKKEQAKVTPIVKTTKGQK